MKEQEIDQFSVDQVGIEQVELEADGLENPIVAESSTVSTGWVSIMMSENNTHVVVRWLVPGESSEEAGQGFPPFPHREDGSRRSQQPKFRGSLVRGSAGQLGFRGTQRGTSYAAEQIVKHVARKVSPFLRDVHVIFRGVGAGRHTVVKVLADAGLNVITVSDATYMPFNGCRPKAKRRV